MVGLVSCEQENNSHEAHEQNEHTETHHEKKDVLNNDWISKIELDNGSKWQANPETTTGVVAMQTLINQRTEKTPEDYKKLAQSLVNEQNKLIDACSMKGASHDNLHHFLHPLIEKIAYLKKVNSIEEGLKTTKSIKENLDAYHTYFK